VAEALQAADEAGGAEGVARNELPGRTLEERADAVEALPWGIVNAIYAYMIGTLNPEAKEQALAQRARSFHGLADTRDDGLPALPLPLRGGQPEDDGYLMAWNSKRADSTSAVLT
jgi:hypothetical protein